jgi:hypothetical protein
VSALPSGEQNAEETVATDLPDNDTSDPLARFRSWHGFLLATLAVNGLFVWGMLANAHDPTQRIWFQTLVWLPFNAIATAVYYAIMQRLRVEPRGCFYLLVCPLLIVANWLVMFLA